MSNDALSKREVLGAEHIPYMRHIDEHTVALANGELLSMIEVACHTNARACRISMRTTAC
jgi:type IV secretory pathway VirB4 component